MLFFIFINTFSFEWFIWYLCSYQILCKTHFWYAILRFFLLTTTFLVSSCHCQKIFFIDVRWFHERKGKCANWSQEGNRKRIENFESGTRRWNTADILEVSSIRAHNHISKKKILTIFWMKIIYDCRIDYYDNTWTTYKSKLKRYTHLKMKW